MAFEFDYCDAPEDVENIQRPSGRPMPGRGMVMITKWSEYTANNGAQHELGMEIVAWSDHSSIALEHTERIWHADRAGDDEKGKQDKRNFADVMMAIALASGVINAAYIKKCKDEKKPIEFNLEDAVGRPVMVELIERPDKKNPPKTYINVAMYGKAFYHIKDKRVADWPRNQNIFNANAHAVGEWITTAKPAAAKTEAKKAVTTGAAATATADPFGGVF